MNRYQHQRLMEESIRARERYFKQDVVRLANEIMRLGETSRTAALQEAQRIQDKHGPGWSIE